MSRASADVAIIGGGLIGVWTAFFLARRGQSVTLFEKGVVGAQSSGTNFGNLRLQGRFPGQYPLSLRSHALWEDFEALIGEGCEFAQMGHLYCAFDADEAARLEAYAQVSESHGLAIERLAPSDLRRRFPWLSERAIAATFCARDATANPRLATPAVARAAQREGVEIRENAPVIAVARQGDGFRITTADGRGLSCAALVNAAGAWAVQMAECFGETAPVFAAGPPQFVTEPMPMLIAPSLQTIDGSVIARQTERGNVILAGYPRTAADAAGKPRAGAAGQDAGCHACPRRTRAGPRASACDPRLVGHRGLSAGHDPGDREEQQHARPVPRVRLLRPWLPDWPRRRALPE